MRELLDVLDAAGLRHHQPRHFLITTGGGAAAAAAAAAAAFLRACVARRRRPPQLRPSTARRRAAAAASRTTHRLIIRKGKNWNEHSKKRKKTRTKIRQNPQSGQMPEKDLCRCKLETGNNQEPKSINQSCLWAAAWLQMKTWKFSQAK